MKEEKGGRERECRVLWGQQWGVRNGSQHRWSQDWDLHSVGREPDVYGKEEETPQNQSHRALMLSLMFTGSRFKGVS